MQLVFSFKNMLTIVYPIPVLTVFKILRLSSFHETERYNNSKNNHYLCHLLLINWGFPNIEDK